MLLLRQYWDSSGRHGLFYFNIISNINIEEFKKLTTKISFLRFYFIHLDKLPFFVLIIELRQEWFCNFSWIPSSILTFRVPSTQIMLQVILIGIYFWQQVKHTEKDFILQDRYIQRVEKVANWSRTQSTYLHWHFHDDTRHIWHRHSQAWFLVRSVCWFLILLTEAAGRRLLWNKLLFELFLSLKWSS